MSDLHMEGLDDNEIAEHIDQGLASLSARHQHGDYSDIGEDQSAEAIYAQIGAADELATAVARACDAWDVVANLLPDFRT